MDERPDLVIPLICWQGHLQLKGVNAWFVYRFLEALAYNIPDETRDLEFLDDNDLNQFLSSLKVIEESYSHNVNLFAGVSKRSPGSWNSLHIS